MDFLALAHTCGPEVDPVTTAAIVRLESDYQPLVIRDNTLHQSWRPRTLQQAREQVSALERQGHQLAIGLMQVSTPWIHALGMRSEQLLDACWNIRIGTGIVARSFQQCEQGGAPPYQALACALSMYWSGSGVRGGVYVNAVFQDAGSPYRVRATSGVSDGLLGLHKPLSSPGA